MHSRNIHYGAMRDLNNFVHRGRSLSKLLLLLCSVFCLLGEANLSAQDVPSLSKTWPTGPHFRSEGNFRAWSSVPDDPLIDLSKLAGISDLSQVHAHGGGWVVLRENGETISSSGIADRENIERICPGWHHFFALISKEGKLHTFVRDKELGPGMHENILGRVVDAFFAPFRSVAINDEGELIVWGSAHDPASEKRQWKVKPTIPEGTKAVAMSSTDHLTAVLLDSGELRAWRSSGPVELPPEFGVGRISQFAVNRTRVFGIPNKGGDGLTLITLPVNDVTVIPFPGAGEIQFKESESGVTAFRGDHSVSSDTDSYNRCPELEAALSHVTVEDTNLFSLFISFPDTPEVRFLWYDKLDQHESLSETPVPPMAPAPAPAAEVTALSPEVAKRINGYQTARRNQIGTFAAEYRVALVSAEALARSSGDLDGLVAIREAKLNADELLVHIKALPKSKEVQPIEPPPALPALAPDTLKAARKAFDTKMKKAETRLYQALDTSLEFVQQVQVKNRKIAEAKDTSELRERFASRFEGLAATKVTAPLPVANTSAEAPPKSTQPTVVVKPGRLEMWSSRDDDDAIRLTRGRGLDDVVQVQLFRSGWIALRENGEAVSSNRDFDKPNIARITKGWDDAFGIIDKEGELIVIASGKAQPKERINNVKDAFISEAHSIALHHDGTITTWGPAYEGKAAGGEKWVPAPTGLSGIDRVLGNLISGVAVTAEGNVTAWRSTGPCRMGSGFTKNIRDISARKNGFRVINAGGMMSWWRSSDSGANSYPDWKERYGPLVTLPDTHDFNFARTDDGSVVVDLKWIERHSDLRSALEDLKGAPEEAFSYFTDGPIHRLGWIEQP